MLPLSTNAVVCVPPLTATVASAPTFSVLISKRAGAARRDVVQRVTAVAVFQLGAGGDVEDTGAGAAAVHQHACRHSH